MPRLRLAPALIERERILGASGQIFFSDPGGAGIQAAKRLAAHLLGRRSDASLPATIRQAASAAPEACAVAARLLLKSRGRAPRHAPIWLECHAEQAPAPDSRVFLTGAKDALGMPRVALDWRVSDLTRRTMKVFADRAGAEFSRLGLGELIVDDWLDREDSDWRGQIGDTIHQMGGARMADDPAQGVVDRNCQVHGIGNLSIASSAVFPTGSFSNPTLTILAIAIRLADHLKQKASR
jgi:choline dehydrogenase-like flavoprotein